MGLFEIFSGVLTGFYALVPSLGLAIILLTLTTRIVLLPLTIKQTRSMREMQLIQPEVKRLQAKHKGDRQKLNEEMMKLYKEHGVNPLGGCLPLLMQFPLLIGLFYVIRSPLKYMGYAEPSDVPSGVFAAPADFVARNVSGFLDTLQHSNLAESLISDAQKVYDFLGLHLNCSASGILNPPKAGDLAQATDASRTLTESCGSGVGSAWPYLILVLLMGFTTYYQQKQMQSSRGAGDQQMQQMQMIGKIMPVMLMFFAFSFPSGVVFYWLTTNVWTIAQQRIMLRAAPPLAPKDKGGSGKDGGGKDGSGGKDGAKAKPLPAADTKAKAKGGASTAGKPTGTKGGGRTKSGGNGAGQRPRSKPNASSKKKKR